MKRESETQKRKFLAILLVLICIISTLLTGCGSSSQEQIENLNEKIAEADEKIETLSKELSEADKTIEELTSLIETGKLNLKKSENYIQISAIRSRETKVNIPYFLTAHEANESPCNLGYVNSLGTSISFCIDGLENAQDITCSISRDSTLNMEPDNIYLENGVYIFEKDFYRGIYLIEISYVYADDEIPQEFYFSVEFN